MTRPFQQWKVLPHGKLSEIDQNILTVTGDIRMPMMSLPRRMTVVRLNGSRLIVFSAIALNEDEMTRLEAYRPSGIPGRAERQASARRETVEKPLSGDAGGRAGRRPRQGRGRGAGRYSGASLRRPERRVRHRSRNARRTRRRWSFARRTARRWC